MSLDADRLAAAKLWLISRPPVSGADAPRDLPYIAHALYALVPVACDEVPRMTADEAWRIYVNPSWLASASIPEIGAELMHMCWHLLHDHAGRARDLGVDAASAASWHQAADAALFGTLAPDRLAGSLPSPVSLGLPADRSAEEYYATLSGLPAGDGGSGEPQDPACGSCSDGLSRGFELPPGLDVGEVGIDEARHLRRLVAIAFREHITSRGTEAGDAWRWSQEILEPVVAWEPLLAGAVRRAVAWTNGHTHYTYNRPSRRQSAVPSIILPGTRRPVPNVALVIDTSGSVDDGLLARALGEVDGALRGVGVSDASVTVLSCDAAVHTVERVRKARDARLGGGGGTDMRVGIGAAVDLRPRPDVIVVFTDGYTPWPETPPAGCAVIVAVLCRPQYAGAPTPAWAKRVECRL